MTDKDLAQLAAVSLAFLALAIILAVIAGCTGDPGPRIEWDRAVTFSGDLRCEGSGSVSILDAQVATVEGKASAGGDGAGISEAGGDACASLTVRVAVYRWTLYAATQDSEACREKAGTLEVEVISQ